MNEKSKPSGKNATGPLPVLIGITGHRDLRDEDLPTLEARIEEILAEFQGRYPSTPLILLTPLAEGADRLAARVALRRGARLIVPLPMPRNEYAKDFESDESRHEFGELLNLADRVFELPLLPGSTEVSIRESGEPRAMQYGLAGAYIVHHCQFLIALWNGVSMPDIGGTSDIVKFQRDGLPDLYRNALSRAEAPAKNLLDPVENGPVYHIVTPRSRHPQIEGEPLTLQRYFPGDDPDDPDDDAEFAETFDRIYTNIDDFNRSALGIESDPALQKARTDNAGYLFPGADAASLHSGMETIRDRFAIADALAQHFQTLTLKSLQRMSVLVFVAALSFEVSAKLAPDNGWFAMVFPGLLGVTYIYWFATVKNGRWQDRYQDYRALAEGLRVEFFWRLIGLPETVADHYLRKQKGELDWIRIAIRNTSDEALRAGEIADSSLAMGLVVKHWVRDQALYFGRAAHRNERELDRLEAWVKLLLAASPAIAVLTAVIGVIPSPVGEWMHHHPLAHKLLIILVFVLAGLAGVIHTYIDKRALSQHVKQFQRMGSLYRMAELRLNQCGDAERPEARQILLELGKASLEENGDWVLMHRERPVDVPHAG